MLLRNYPVALNMSMCLLCGVPTDLTGSCSALRSVHNKTRISLQALLYSSIYKFNNEYRSKKYYKPQNRSFSQYIGCVTDVIKRLGHYVFGDSILKVILLHI